MITLELEIRQAAAVREALLETTKMFTYDPACTPERVIEIRKAITDLDEAISKHVL